MPGIDYFQIFTRNVLLSIGIILLIDLALVNILKGFGFSPVLLYSLLVGTLAGLATAAYEILLEYKLRKKVKRKKLLVRKVNQSINPSYYIRLMRLFIISSTFCLLLITLSSFFEPYPLSVYAQLSVVPVLLALGANVSQTYVLCIDIKGPKKKLLNVVQYRLRDSVFSVSYKANYHLEYQLDNSLRYLYAYCFAPDRCTLEMLIYQNHIEIIGASRYLEAIMDDPYIFQVISEQQKKDSDKVTQA
ncbi:hypothetical protein OKW21_006417 [Catalinimonas alkaloidigena]|uniref:hypothetical protein n=1 Tax=Catalinimonas alkaloidigena TaxID=1075417 RepID=UPI00240516B8|nr:hypothetical protein [Catalinimonas alkaloidigena]MDF9801154.1 hypothetical protein [Catalinimonas alkaloidigena]